MKRRKKIRIVLFASVLVISLTAWGILSTVTAHKYKTLAELNNQKALTQMCEYMDTIETALIKSIYSSSAEMLSSLSSELSRSCSGAKESLAALSSGETELFNTYRFLSQVGDYTAYINKKTAAGEEITAEERQTLKTLSVYAAELSLKFEHMASLLSADYFTFEEIKNQMKSADSGSESMVSYLDSISDAEMSFEDYPTLIYDGPFSDNILTKESILLNDCEEITIDEAKDIAAEILGTEKKLLAEERAADGRIEAYCFRTDSQSISITKKGGFPLEIMTGADVGEVRLTMADAGEKAAVFLNDSGFPDMVSTYSAVNDGICTVNFAFKQGSFICYPDLIKVSVSMNDGKILGFNATDYIMNHHDRAIPDFSVDPYEAMENIAPGLTVRKISAAVIPTDSASERFTYEILCDAEDGQDILIYKDITTGEEADILILLYSDNGTLTK